jgi:signal transduction histidine kinase
VEIKLTKTHGHAIIFIRDNGKGMTPDARENLFVPFFSTKPHGCGLGLTSAQNIVIGHKGKIDVKSEVGKGTELIISLPTE